MAPSLLLIACGFAVLVLAANLLVDGSCAIARRLGLSDRVIGLTVVAVGTAMPELVVGVTSAVEGHAEMAYGNVVGSCMANLLLILGLSAVISPLGLSRRTLRFEVPASVAAVALLALLSNARGGLGAGEGLLLLAAFAAFVAVTVVSELRGGGADEAAEAVAAVAPDGAAGVVAAGGGSAADAAGSEGRRRRRPSEAVSDAAEGSALVALGLVVAGIALLKVGAEVVVTHSVLVAGWLGVSERVIGLTVVALGTCLPELVTSLVAAARGNADLAVGNVIGSNLTNALLVMGLPALFSPMAFDAGYNLDFALLAVCSLALLAFAATGERRVMGRANGAVFVGLYVAYVVLAVVA